MARLTPARRCGAPAAGSIKAAVRHIEAALAALLATCPLAAAAEPGYSVSLASDDRFRGRSTSDGLPVATATLSYDDRRGPYIGASLTAGPTRHDGVRLLKTVEYIGFAQRLSSRVTVDAGVSRYAYSRHATVDYARKLTQVYAGVIGRRWSARLSHAPDYDGYGHAATYAEVQIVPATFGPWSLTSHAGVLSPLSHARYPTPWTVDWRIGVVRSWNRLTIGTALVGRGPDRRVGAPRAALVAAITRAF